MHTYLQLPGIAISHGTQHAQKEYFRMEHVHQNRQAHNFCTDGFFFCIVNALIILVAFQLSEHG
jgi:hypothetical protein